MKNLIKFSIVVLLLSFGVESFAQKLGLKAGVNLSNLLVKDDEETYSDDFKMNPGFHIGPTVEFPINEIISFESGLLLSTKGFRVSDEEIYLGDTYEYEQKMNLFYVDVPLTAKASFDIGGPRIYGVFGPYIGVGLIGKYKSEMTAFGETETEEEDIEWGSDEDEDDLKRLDYGLTMGAGVEISSLQIGLSYDFGLANISPYTDDTVNNRILRFSLGYIFGRK